VPNVYTACWTMHPNVFGGSAAGQRADELSTMALLADTHLKIMGNAGGGGYTRMLVVPEYYFAAGGAIVSRDDKHVIYRRLMGISAQVPELVLIAGTIAYVKGAQNPQTYNVCPVLQGGQIVKKLYKADDDGVYQINGDFRTKNDNGKGVPLFNVNGISIGVDICMDYVAGAAGRLGNYLAANALPAPDIHIQISGSHGAFANSAHARVGGVYVHCDLGTKRVAGARAFRIAAAGTAEIQPTHTLNPNAGGFLKLFDLPV
jgi:hypothetical protein